MQAVLIQHWVEQAHAYFTTLNPLAWRIACDIGDTQLSYGRVWYTLNCKEKNQIINDRLIKPEIQLHYYDSTVENAKPWELTSERNCCKDDNVDVIYTGNGNDRDTTSLKKKISMNGELAYFRDEHSQPFTFRSKSQMVYRAFKTDTTADDLNSSPPINSRVWHCSATALPSALKPHCASIETTTLRLFEQPKKAQHRLGEDTDDEDGGNDDEDGGNDDDEKIALLNSQPENLKLKSTKCIVNSALIMDCKQLLGITKSMENVFSLHPQQQIVVTSSPAVMSDEELDKSTDEDTSLLRNAEDVSLRKGFDFLNNW